MESLGNAARPFPVVPNCAGCFEAATIKDEDKDTPCLFPDLAELVLDLQSNFEYSVTEVLANDRFIASPDSASPFCYKLIPSNDLPSLSSARTLPSATAWNQLRGFSKTPNIGGDCTIITAPDMDSFTNKLSCKNVANFRSLMGSIVIGEHFHSNCLWLKALSDSDAAVLPFDRGPSKLLSTFSGSLRSLPFDRGPCLSLAALRVIPRLFFQVSEVFLSMCMESASGSALPVPMDLCTSLLELVTGRMMTSLTLCLLWQGKLKVLDDGASRPNGRLLPLPASVSLFRGDAAGLAQGVDSVVNPV
jgi:hypothetical protein